MGGGSGFGINFLSSIAKSLSVIEYSNENIEFLKKFEAKANIYQMDAHNLSFQDKSFDTIIALAMVYYLSLELFLREAYRTLDHEGTLFFCTSNKDVPGFCEAPHTTKYYSIPEMSKILSSCGFKVKFYGAFATSTDSLWKIKARAFIKDTLKEFLHLFPGGKEAWKNLREKYFGKRYPLPSSIEEMQSVNEKLIRLEPDSKNFIYRVIYVVAEKSR